jgi:hypothetical protein
MRARTRPFWAHESVLEIPVSWLAFHRRDGVRRALQWAPMADHAGQVPAAVQLARAKAGGPMPLVYLAHSYSLLAEHRSRDDGLRDAWNRAFGAIVSEEEYRLAHLVPSAELLFLEGLDERRMAGLHMLLHALASRDDVRSATFPELCELGLERLVPRSAQVEPVAEWHEEAGRAALSGARAYSRAYLDHLEAAAA